MVTESYQARNRRKAIEGIWRLSYIQEDRSVCHHAVHRCERHSRARAVDQRLGWGFFQVLRIQLVICQTQPQTGPCRKTTGNKYQVPISSCSQCYGSLNTKRCALTPTTCRFLYRHMNKPKATENKPWATGSALLQKLNQKKGCSLRFWIYLSPVLPGHYLTGPQIVNKTIDYSSENHYLSHYLN